MGITVRCRTCSRSYRVRDACPEKRLKCRNCGGLLDVPGSIAQESETDFLDGLDEAVELEAQATVVRPVRKPVSSSANKSAADSVGSASKRKRKRRRGMPWGEHRQPWIMLGGAAILFALPLFGTIPAWISLTCAFLLATGANVAVLVTAFREDTICGLLCLFLPFYSLYYIVTRFDDVWHYVLLGCLAMTLYAFSSGRVGAHSVQSFKPRTMLQQRLLRPSHPVR